jgi:hypothetical protein
MPPEETYREGAAALNPLRSLAFREITTPIEVVEDLSG